MSDPVSGFERAWAHALRGYDAVHLASAIFWQDTIGEPVTVVTFDRQLWDGARRSMLAVFPAAWPAGRG